MSAMVVNGLPGLEPKPLDDDEHHPQADAQGRIQVVNTRGESELKPGKT